MDNIIKNTNSILYIDGVTVSFDGFKALNNLSFTVPPIVYKPSSAQMEQEKLLSWM